MDALDAVVRACSAAGDRDRPVSRSRSVDDAIDRTRAGFAIADRVLRDTLDDHHRGEVETAELLVALEEHRRAYERYLRALYRRVRGS